MHFPFTLSLALSAACPRCSAELVRAIPQNAFFSAVSQVRVADSDLIFPALATHRLPPVGNPTHRNPGKRKVLSLLRAFSRELIHAVQSSYVGCVCHHHSVFRFRPPAIRFVCKTSFVSTLASLRYPTPHLALLMHRTGFPPIFRRHRSPLSCLCPPPRLRARRRHRSMSPPRKPTSPAFRPLPAAAAAVAIAITLLPAATRLHGSRTCPRRRPCRPHNTR